MAGSFPEAELLVEVGWLGGLDKGWLVSTQLFELSRPQNI